MRRSRSLSQTVDDPDDADAAESAALRILGGASQSADALQQRLLRRGFSPAAAGAAVSRCRELGYVDDSALAESVISRHRRAGHGRARIVADLRGRRLSDQTVRDVVAGLEEDDEEAAVLAAARALFDREARRGEMDDGALRRVAGALQRRGFSSALIRKAIRIETAAAASPVREDST